MTEQGQRAERRRADSGASPVILMLALMWAVFALEHLLPLDWTRLGVIARDPASWYTAITAPFIHVSLAHIIGNSIPFAALGWLVARHGPRALGVVVACSMVMGWAGAWLLAPAGTVVVGASGLVFGFFTYLVVSAVVPGTQSLGRALMDFFIAAAVIIIYGAAIWRGILHAGPSVSWQMHLGGAIGGVGAALLAPRQR